MFLPSAFITTCVLVATIIPAVAYTYPYVYNYPYQVNGREGGGLVIVRRYIPAYAPPRQQFTPQRQTINSNYAEFCENLPLYQRAAEYIRQANISPQIINNVTTLARNWDIDGVKNAIFVIVSENFNGNDRNAVMQLLDELSPPLSFTDALAVFTIEQRAQVVELFRKRRYQEIGVIVNGLITSLPDVDQKKARRFIEAVRYLSNCFPRF
uniref:TPM_phosphatase domain-containing protein n=1 Tax=Panagrellus redivivus TaxID=6233 RepID=A0A7E4V337_PANRE